MIKYRIVKVNYVYKNPHEKIEMFEVRELYHKNNGEVILSDKNIGICSETFEGIQNELSKLLIETSKESMIN
jgi:hypothetical protein